MVLKKGGFRNTSKTSTAMSNENGELAFLIDSRRP